MTDLNFEGLSDKQLMLFTVRCARRVQHLMTDPRSIVALDVAERYAHGQATDAELADAADAAWDSAGAAWYTAGAAARAAGAAALAAGAAGAAAMDVAWAARDAAGDAERAEQKKILDEIRQEQPK